MDGRHLAAAARRLALDAVTGEVVEAMRRRGVRPLLVKGPVLERWLYGDGTERRYGDVDLVVAHDRFADAEGVLAELGFALRLDTGTHVALPKHEHGWVRYPHSIDLHRGIWGLNGDPETVWSVLTEDVDRFDIGGTSVEVPSVAMCALLVALHAVQHGQAPKPREDLRRALAACDESTWRAAAELADRVGALGPLAMGLRLFLDGQNLVTRLPLPDSASVDDHLRAAGETRVASGFHRLAQAPTARARLVMLIDELWPSREFMRLQEPFARRRRGLVIAHVWRVVSLCCLAPRAWLAWRRAVVAARRSGSGGQPARMSARRKVTLGVEILIAYARLRRRMVTERDTRALLAITRRGHTAADEQAVPTGMAEGRRLGRAVSRALWMLPAERGCLARSLVLVDLLQRRGIEAKLVIGAQADPAFHADAWVECNGEPLLSPGGFQDSRLAEL